MVNISDCFGHWRVAPNTPAELATAQAVVTHEFGNQKDVSSSTAAIVDTAVELTTTHNLPLMCQWPGNSRARQRRVEPALVVKEHQLRPGAYLDTEEVNRQFAEMCRSQGWTRVIICAHPHHLWRAGKNLEHHGLQVLYPDMSRARYDSGLRRVRPELSTPLLFIPRETLARLLYRRKGYL